MMADETSSRSTRRHDDIDRLVAGDLEQERRNTLLAWLDADPGRWRRCGLAFIEAQTLRESFALLADRAGSTPTPVVEPSRDTISTNLRHNTAADLPRRRHAVLTVAAAVLIAFSFGGLFGYGVRTPHVAQAPNDPHAVQPGPDAGDHAQEVAAAAERSMLRLRTGDGEHAREFTVAVREAAGDGNRTLRHPELPPYVRSQWERKGYRVTQQRRLMPLRLEDGRQVVIPLAEVTLTYMGRQTL